MINLYHNIFKVTKNQERQRKQEFQGHKSTLGHVSNRKTKEHFGTSKYL